MSPQISHYTIEVDRGLSYDAAEAKLFEAKTDAAFYESKRKMYGQRVFLLAVAKPSDPGLYIVTRPNTGESRVEMDRDKLAESYRRLPLPQRQADVAAPPPAGDGAVEAMEALGPADAVGADIPGAAVAATPAAAVAAAAAKHTGSSAEDTAMDGNANPGDAEVDGGSDAEGDDGESDAESDTDASAQSARAAERDAAKLAALQKGWADIFEKTRDGCIHFSGCKAGKNCRYGRVRVRARCRRAGAPLRRGQVRV